MDNARSLSAKTQRREIATFREKCASLMTTLSYKGTIRLGFLCLLWTVAKAAAADSSGTIEQAFLGRWDLTIKDSEKKELPSWLELSAKQGEWKARFVGRW